jgi:hypothetical protein|tara:strand:+ start:575 stop:820 length:246 start_codon:yes stop_codon:yes gene_type:complete
MKMYDVVSGRKVIGQEKKRWTNVGIAFEGDDGRITGIKLNALPLQNENGEVWLSLFEQKPRDNVEAFNRATEDILDDEIPV